MPRRKPYDRIPVLLSPPMRRRIEALALETGSNRCEVIRLAVDHGFSKATRELRRQHRDRLQQAGVEPAASASPDGSRSLLSYEDAVAKLRTFGNAIWADDERPSQGLLHHILHTYASRLPISPEDFENAVAEAWGLVLDLPDPDPDPWDGPPGDPVLPSD